MVERHRARRIAKWTGLVVCVLILAGWAASGWWYIQYYAWGQREYCSLSMRRGAFQYESVIPGTEPGVVQAFVGGRAGMHGWEIDTYYEHGSLLPEPRLPHFASAKTTLKLFVAGDVVPTCVETVLHLPLWTPLLLVGTPTAYSFWRDRRRIPPNHCRKCGYNLTGNESGVCPECGSEVDAATAPSARQTT
jgi:hypothetical protein